MRHAGTGRRVLVIGDSHAEMWIPPFLAIAKRRNWQLATLTRPGCGPLDYNAARASDAGGPTFGDRCQAWRSQAYPTVIRRFDPQLVVFGGRTQHYDIRSGGHVIRLDRERAAWVREWTRSWRWTVATLRAGGAQLGAMSLQPSLKGKAPDCLLREGLRSAACNTPARYDGITRQLNAFVRHVRSVYPTVRPIPLAALSCPHGICQAYQHGLVTYRDSSHVTATWARSRTHVVARLLRNTRLA